MDPVPAFEWQRLFFGDFEALYILEILFRVFIVFFSGMFILRLAGKRSRKQMTSFDMLILIALGSAAGDVLFYPKVPLIYAIVILLTIALLSRLMGYIEARSEGFHDLIADTPAVLIMDGKIVDDAMRSEMIAKDELMSMLREQSIENVGEIRRGYLELSGGIGLIKFDKGNEVIGESTLPVEEAVDNAPPRGDSK